MKFVIATLLIFFNFTMLSQENLSVNNLRVIEVRISTVENNSQILLGSEEPIKLELSDEIPIHFFQTLVNDKFIFDDGLYLSQVKEVAVTKIGFSRIFEARAAFAKPVVPNTQFKLELVQMGVQLQFINLNIEAFNDQDVAKAKTPTVVDQNLSPVTSYLLEAIIILILLILIIIGWLVYSKKRHLKYRVARKKKEWLELLNKAQSRRDFELIYASNEHWREVLDFDKKRVVLFGELVMRNQYKRDWSPDLLNDVTIAHKKMLQSLEHSEGS